MSARIFLRWALFCLVVLLPGATLAWPQANISGQVSDQSKGVIQGAELVLADSANGEPLRTTTDSKGHFVIKKVPAGHYMLTVSHAGFKTTAPREIVVTPQSIDSPPSPGAKHTPAKTAPIQEMKFVVKMQPE
jgi:hypothetical protein